MRTIFVICVFFSILLAVQCSPKNREIRAAAQSRYTSKYDNIDVNSILASKRLLFSYINCILDKGPCSPEGKELKTQIPDALVSECSKCTEKQRNIVGKVMVHVLQNHKEAWDEIAAKYDPEGKFLSKYEGEEDYSDFDVAK